MIILDTNIISEMMKTSPSTNVIHWFDQQDVTQLFITTVTIAEISYGLKILPEGNRRSMLENAFQRTLQEAFQNRILSFDTQSALLFGELMAHRKKRGKPLGVPDGQISAITLLHQAAIATRNVTDFIDCNLAIINPYEYSN